MIYVTDDRDSSVPAYDWAPRIHLRMLTLAEFIRTIHRIRQWPHTPRQMNALILQSLAVPTGVLILCVCIGLIGHPAVALPLQLGVVLIIALSAPLYFYSFVRRLQTDNPVRAAQLLIEERRCPSCGYSITGLSLEPDACTVCPECGAAWKLPHPPATTTPPHTTISTGFPPNS